MTTTQPGAPGSAAVLSSQETFAHHAAALRAEQMEDLLATFAEDAVVIAHNTVYRGVTGVRQVFNRLWSELPHATWDADRVWADDVLFVEWKARTATTRVEDGVDTFVFREGKIQVQTIHYTVQTR